eukprot:Phypoly_transcript_09617.p1 GENE.Phypoly_transcript_09617~~Phypoly_transcript_09617.p1  ORF type:complete len:256 (+),score=7.53 Phypoly_transcript_09617:80-847(+)
MMSSISCAVALLLFCSVAFARSLLNENPRAIDTCYKLTCYNYNETCVAQQSFCTGNSSCVTEGTGTGICKPYSPLATQGSACTFNDDCYSDRCINHLCNEGYTPGTPCSNDNQCLFIDTSNNYVTSCVNKRCSGLANGIRCDRTHQCDPPLTCGPDNVCMQPRDLGAPCDVDSDCDQPNICVNDVCTATLKENDNCDRLNDLCGGNTICTPRTRDGSIYQCVQAFSQKAGDWCTGDIHCGDKLSRPETLGFTCLS